MKDKAKEILENREKRVKIQEHLLNRFKLPLLVLRVNYPGVNKDNELTKNIIEIMDATISQLFQYDIEFKMVKFSAEGPFVIMVLKREAVEIKKIAIDIEEKHILGRCMDIDVHSPLGTSISRQDLGYPMRKCFLCEEIAQNCVRSRQHSEREVIAYINGKYREYVDSFYEKNS